MVGDAARLPPVYVVGMGVAGNANGLADEGTAWNCGGDITAATTGRCSIGTGCGAAPPAAGPKGGMKFGGRAAAIRTCVATAVTSVAMYDPRAAQT